MEVVQGWADLIDRRGTVLTIGVFDGVHLGHQSLVRGVVQRAQALGVRSAVLTFHPHPRSILAPDSSWGYLCSLEERVARIAELGTELLVVLRFTPELAAKPAEVFIEELLQHVSVRELHVGADFGLGRDRQGNVDLLRALGQRCGFVVRSIPPVCLDGRVVSSTHIRELVQAGRVDAAVRWLGRLFSLRGEVVGGDGQGHRLGFPTANLHLHSRQVLPGDGVYAAWVRLPSAVPASLPEGTGGHRLPGLAYVGRRPTFGPGERVVEVHLFDFARDLLGYELRVEFVRRLRPDQVFPSVEKLIEQMRRDADQARALLAPAASEGVGGES